MGLLHLGTIYSRWDGLRGVRGVFSGMYFSRGGGVLPGQECPCHESLRFDLSLVGIFSYIFPWFL